uniref:Uncharacterized protein n=1 Tax=viral metagenome TaxID=1070528 RepID=A0A6C0KF40_9ZZZZ
MDSFPSSLHISNKEMFTKMLHADHLGRLRRDIMYHMLHQNESDFFDLDIFNRTYVKDTPLLMSLVNIVTGELNKLGWTTYLGFGDTGLYIYSTSEKPNGVY